MTIRVLVVDDEPLARDELGYLLSRQEGVEVVGEAEDGQSAFEKVTALRPDVVFLDIEMHGENGMDVARRFLTLTPPPRVVFATAYDHYALQAFEVKALDYIVKPFTQARVAETVERLKEAVPPPLEAPVKHPRPDPGAGAAAAGKKPARIAIEQDERIVVIAPESILFAARDERSTLIRTDGGQTYRCNLALQELEERLQDYAFFRPHRAYLVNLERIAEIHPWFNGAYELVMLDKEKTRVPVSRTSARRLKELLGF